MNDIICSVSGRDLRSVGNVFDGIVKSGGLVNRQKMTNPKTSLLSLLLSAQIGCWIFKTFVDTSCVILILHSVNVI